MVYGGGGRNIIQYRCNNCRNWFWLKHIIYLYYKERLYWFCCEKCKNEFLRKEG